MSAGTPTKAMSLAARIREQAASAPIDVRERLRSIADEVDGLSVPDDAVMVAKPRFDEMLAAETRLAGFIAWRATIRRVLGLPEVEANTGGTTVARAQQVMHDRETQGQRICDLTAENEHLKRQLARATEPGPIAVGRDGKPLMLITFAGFIEEIRKAGLTFSAKIEDNAL